MSRRLTHRRRRGPRQQRGIMALLFTIGAIALIGAAGMALDLGLTYLARTRLQNALDAAALDGAKTLNETLGNSTLAIAAASARFTANMGALGNGITPVIQTSPTLDPFNAGGANPAFLRVTVSALLLPVRLASVLPGVGSTFTISGSAVAGRLYVNNYCGAFPVMLCGTNDGDSDCSDYKCFGLTGGPTTETVLTNPSSSIGPGNYAFIVLNGCTGGSCLRDALGGATNFCFSVGKPVTTEPGMNTGPASQGYNTRFGIYKGAGVDMATFPPDVITTNNDSGTPSFFYSNYLSGLQNSGSWNYQSPPGVPDRRLVRLPIVDCSTPINGRTDVNVIGAACFFLTRTLQGTSSIYGQLTQNCPTSGTPSATPPPNGGSIVVLYQDPDNPRGL